MSLAFEDNVYQTIIDDYTFQNDIVKIIDDSTDEFNFKTNVKAKMTSYHMKDLPGFNTLGKYMIAVCERISYIKYNIKVNVHIKTMWGMCYENKDHALSHDHWPATWACAYYIKPTKDSPELIFPDYNIGIKPKDGLLVVFPGWLKHKVNSQEFEGKRYVVSSNLFVE